ncbi:SAV_2336 N-terminal domain-related protein [Streptomyces sp. MS06]|uniref:SAV_2336 N-terminal domain-related protein n=1 Tax=Streptomyces sp. MS06 TaxID=3385974 RepID=UPI0039A1BF3C
MEPQASGTPVGAASPALTALVAHLRRAGLTPDAEALADALWLARWLPGSGVSAAGGGTGSRGGTAEPPRTPGAVPPSPSPPEAGGEPHRLGGARLFVPGAPGGPGARAAPGAGGDGAAGPDAGEGGAGTGAPMTSVRVPAAPALPEPLALQRGLRPLQRYHPPTRPVPRILDEEATAERAAESGIVLPVLRADRRRAARLLLVMDVSTSTVVWQQALDELRQVCARAGAFREVQVRYLHPAPDGGPGCAAGPDPAGVLYPPEQLSDPTGRRVTLVLSDCAGPMWRSGRMQRLLHRWAATGPVAVVQPLPQRMWRRTHLPARRGRLHRREGAAGSLDFRPDAVGRSDTGGRTGAGGRPALPVPVLALRREAVEGWARLVAGSTGRSLAAAAGWVRPDHPASGAAVRAAEDLDGAQRVRAFWRAASPEARRLAVYLSAVPLYLPVMQMVQHAMLAGSGPDVLSEVLLGGLLRRRADADDPAAVRYGYLPQVAGELRALLAAEDADLLFKHCSHYVERHYGRTVRNFPAMARAFLRGVVAPGVEASPAPHPGDEEPPGLRAFAEVSTEVLREFGARIPPGPAGPGLRAAELLERGQVAFARFEREGLTRELDTAVRYLRQAIGAVGPDRVLRAAREELAGALLARWQARAVGDDLREAWEALGDRPPVTARGRLVRGLVLFAQAREVRAAGTGFPGLSQDVRSWAAAGEGRPRDRACALLLYLADTFLTDLLAGEGSPPAATDERRSAARTLAAVRRALAESGPGPGAVGAAPMPETWYALQLHRAEQAADVWVALDTSAEARAARGRLLLDLARHRAGRGPVPASELVRPLAAELAERAARELRSALLGDPSALPEPDRGPAWLDLAEAEELARPDAGAGAEAVLHALEQGLGAAGGDPALRYECRARAAAVHRARYDATGDLDHLDRAVAAWTEAEPLLGGDDPRRPAVLAECGLALLDRADARSSATDVGRAVHLLRRAVEESPAGDPALPRRRHLLGTAYFRRYGAEPVLSYLYEADWLFDEAARDAADPALTARCWTDRGRTLDALHAGTGATGRLHQAIDCFSRGAAHAREVPDEELLAQCLLYRGRAREQLAQTTRVLADYREALLLTSEPDTARFLRARLDALEPGTADE